MLELARWKGPDVSNHFVGGLLSRVGGSWTLSTKGMRPLSAHSFLGQVEDGSSGTSPGRRPPGRPELRQGQDEGVRMKKMDEDILSIHAVL